MRPRRQERGQDHAKEVAYWYIMHTERVWRYVQSLGQSLEVQTLGYCVRLGSQSSDY